MNRGDLFSLDTRVLLLPPTNKDGMVTQGLLQSAGIVCAICPSFDNLLRELQRGAAAMLVPEEAATTTHNVALARLIAEQPPWSDLPVLVLTRPGADSAASAEAIRMLGNVTLLERPLRVATLLSAVRTALRARERQYQIREHLAERVRAEEALRLADRRKDEFLATLGHELRNPLAPLLTGLRLINVTGGSLPQVGRLSAVMQRQVAHLARLVDDLLEVSRITRGLIEIHREPIDLVVAARSAIDITREGIDEAKHTLHVDTPDEPVTVFGDTIRLTQVFANLLTNAVKYTNPGGTIRLTVRKDTEHALVSVRDNGVGIPASQLESIFDMFNQVDRSSRRAQGGLGIGLTIVRSLVGMHGGRVEAHSAGAGAGSEFVVQLPLHVAAVVSAPETDVRRVLPPRRILVVDDNADAADTMGALLEALGATVSVAYSGPSALELLPCFNPDAVLMDIGMPEMDGYEVCRQIRAMPRRGILLIALSGWGQEHDYRRSRAVGFDHHLVKPPDIDALCELLRGSDVRLNQ